MSEGFELLFYTRKSLTGTSAFIPNFFICFWHDLNNNYDDLDDHMQNLLLLEATTTTKLLGLLW